MHPVINCVKIQMFWTPLI